MKTNKEYVNMSESAWGADTLALGATPLRTGVRDTIHWSHYLDSLLNNKTGEIDNMVSTHSSMHLLQLWNTAQMPPSCNAKCIIKSHDKVLR